MPEFEARDRAQQVNIGGDNTGPVTVTTMHQTTPPPRPVVTATLRRDAATFVGRDQELKRILRAAGSGRVVSIHTIDGMAGVGKTALAVRAAHKLKARFPDGQYFVSLHAHTPGQAPADPFEVLAGLLGDLGVDPHALPDTLSGRCDLWRDRLAGKRILLVLDDARDHAQIEPLLPGGYECLTLVTSRRRLVALDGALPLALDVLEPEPAGALFITLAGREVGSDADRVAVADIVRRCGYLPLAIVLLAGRLAHHPAWSITELASEFAAADRLAALEAGDRAVRAAFTLSYRDLTSRQQLLFRRVGLHPGRDFEAAAAAALADIPVKVAQGELEALYVDHLLEETLPGRYRLHDLLRDYVRTLVTSAPVIDNDRAVDRLLDYYQRTADAAEHYLPHRTRFASAQPTVTDFHDRVGASAWMHRERANLLACLELTATDQPARMVELTGVLAGMLDRDGTWLHARRLHERAVEVAARLGDRIGQANALTNLGIVCEQTGDYQEAADLHRQALKIFQDSDHWHGQADVLTTLGVMQTWTANYREAADLLRQALRICQDIGYRSGEATALGALGLVGTWTGDYEKAAALQQRALEMAQNVGHRYSEIFSCVGLGLMRMWTGKYDEATRMQQRALEISREIGSRVGQADVLTNLGLIQICTGNYREAADLSRHALAMCQDIGFRRGEAGALIVLGQVWIGIGNFDEAAALEQRALEISRDIRFRWGESLASLCLGLVRTWTGKYDEADPLQQRALEISREVDDRYTQASVLGALGLLRARTGDYRKAADLYQQAVTLSREIGYRFVEATALTGLGLVRVRTGDYREAADLYQRALTLSREIGNRSIEASALRGLGVVRAWTGDYGQAADLYEQALGIHREIGHRRGEVIALNELGTLLCETGCVHDALKAFTTAHDMAREIGSRREQARALDGLVRCQVTLSATDTALPNLAEARDLYRKIGAPEADTAAAYPTELQASPQHS